MRQKLNIRIQKHIEDDYNSSFLKELQYDREGVKEEIKMLKMDLE